MTNFVMDYFRRDCTSTLKPVYHSTCVAWLYFRLLLRDRESFYLTARGSSEHSLTSFGNLFSLVWFKEFSLALYTVHGNCIKALEYL